MSHRVESEAFAGPIDLLLQLISAHELDVLEIPLAPIVDAFVTTLAAEHATMSMDDVSEFLLVAAILVELKSKRILPGPDEVEEDEDLVAWEARDVLLARLLECRAYAAAGELFVTLAENAARSVPREVGIDDGFEVHAPDLLAGVVPGQLAEAFLRVTEVKAVPPVDLGHVTVDTVTVTEAVNELMDELPAGPGSRSFRQLTAHLETRIEIIVRFLALLELCKLGRVELGQGRTFGDLEVHWIGGDRALSPVGAGDLVDEYEG